MLYGSVDEKATKVTSVKVLAHRRKITGATPDGTIILAFDADTFNEKFTEYVESRQGKWDADCKYWNPTHLRLVRLSFNPDYCQLSVFYSFSRTNYYRYSTLIDTRIDSLRALCAQWGVTISNNIPAGTDNYIPLESEIISTETKPLKVMYGSRNNRTKTIYK